VRHKRTRAYELLNWAKSHAFQPRQGIPGLESPTFCERHRKSLSHRQISREPQRPSGGRVADGVADNCHAQADALLTALLTTVTRQRFSRNLVRNSILDQVLQWAVQDLNLRPLACHAHISCSPALSDVQISSHRSTFGPLRFANVGSDLLALLTALLTEYLCRTCQGSFEPPSETFITWCILLVLGLNRNDHQLNLSHKLSRWSSWRFWQREYT